MKGRLWGSIVAVVLASTACGGGGGTEVGLVAFLSGGTDAGTVTFNVNGETTTVDLGPDSKSTSRSIELDDGDFSIDILIENDGDLGDAVCGIDGLGSSIEMGAAISARCHAEGTIDGSTRQVESFTDIESGADAAAGNDEDFEGTIEVGEALLVPRLTGAELDETIVIINADDGRGNPTSFHQLLEFRTPGEVGEMSVQILVDRSSDSSVTAGFTANNYVPFDRETGFDWSEPELRRFGMFEGEYATTTDGIELFIFSVSPRAYIVKLVRGDGPPPPGRPANIRRPDGSGVTIVSDPEVIEGVVEGHVLLADISRYTEFLTSTELEHPRAIATELTKLIRATLTPPMQTVKLEGDAVFCFAPLEVASGGIPAQIGSNGFKAYKYTNKMALACGAGHQPAAARLGMEDQSHIGRRSLRDRQRPSPRL